MLPKLYWYFKKEKKKHSLTTSLRWCTGPEQRQLFLKYWVHAISKAFSIHSPTFASLVLFCFPVPPAPSQPSWSSAGSLPEPFSQTKQALELQKGLHEGQNSSGKKMNNFQKLMLSQYNAIYLGWVEKVTCATRKDAFYKIRWIKIIIISNKFKPHSCLAAFPSCKEFIQRPFYLWWNKSDITLCHERML